MNYVIYNPDNGKVIGNVQCNPDEIEFNTPPGMRFVAGWADGPSRVNLDTLDVVKGEAVDDRPLAARKRDLWGEMKKLRESEEYGGFEWEGLRFDSDPVSLSRITGAALTAVIAAQAGQTYSTTWTLSDDSTVVLTGPQMIQVGLALGRHVADVHAKGRGVRQAIENAPNANALAAISWPR